MKVMRLYLRHKMSRKVIKLLGICLRYLLSIIAVLDILCNLRDGCIARISIFS